MSESADGSSENIQADTLSTGLECSPAFDESPPALHVSWIRWNSAFRDSGLRPGDRIVAVNGERVVPPPQPSEPRASIPRFVGNYREPEAWKAREARDGDAVTLGVRRRAAEGEGWSELEICGSIRLERHHRNVRNQPLYGAGGPVQMDRDGFDRVWSDWYENVLRQWRPILDGSDWTRRGFSNEPALKAQQEHAPRLRALGEKYAGARFADAARADYEAVCDTLRGRAYTLPPDALAYRELRERRAREVSAAGGAARAAFLQAHAAELIPAFPAIDPILGDRAAVTGKLIELPAVTERDWISQGAGTCFLFANGRHCYAADAEGPGVQKLLIAERRFEKAVAPIGRREFRMIARITGEPALIVQGERGVFGLKVEPVAVSLGEHFFVELSPQQGDTPLFAGERELGAALVAPPPDDAGPRAVMEAFFAALKLGDETLWRSLFSRWDLRFTDNRLPRAVRVEPSRLDGNWIDARRQILEKVCDVRVVWVDEIQRPARGDEYEGAPRVEQTVVEVDHIRQMEDGSFRSFVTLNLNRMWVLQRWSGGPWRIASFWGI